VLRRERQRGQRAAARTVNPSLFVAEKKTRYAVFPMLSRGWLPALRAASARRLAAAFRSLSPPSSSAAAPSSLLRRASLRASSGSPPARRRVLPGALRRATCAPAPPECSAAAPGAAGARIGVARGRQSHRSAAACYAPPGSAPVAAAAERACIEGSRAARKHQAPALAPGQPGPAAHATTEGGYRGRGPTTAHKQLCSLPAPSFPTASNQATTLPRDLPRTDAPPCVPQLWNDGVRGGPGWAGCGSSGRRGRGGDGSSGRAAVQFLRVVRAAPPRMRSCGVSHCMRCVTPPARAARVRSRFERARACACVCSGWLKIYHFGVAKALQVQCCCICLSRSTPEFLLHTLSPPASPRLGHSAPPAGLPEPDPCAAGRRVGWWTTPSLSARRPAP